MEPPYGLGCNPELIADGLCSVAATATWSEALLLNSKMLELVASRTSFFFDQTAVV